MSKITPPVAPPEPVVGVPGPTFVACDGLVWRRSMQDWWPIEDLRVCTKLLAGFREDQANTADWFHARAGELADELETAINLAQARKEVA